jgi:hypothetical protein
VGSFAADYAALRRVLEAGTGLPVLEANTLGSADALREGGVDLVLVLPPPEYASNHPVTRREGKAMVQAVARDGSGVAASIEVLDGVLDLYRAASAPSLVYLTDFATVAPLGPFEGSSWWGTQLTIPFRSSL